MKRREEVREGAKERNTTRVRELNVVIAHYSVRIIKPISGLAVEVTEATIMGDKLIEAASMLVCHSSYFQSSLPPGHLKC